jgi:hypothetical protein
MWLNIRKLLLLDFIVYMSKNVSFIQEEGTAYPSRTPGLIPGFDGVYIVHNFSFTDIHLLCDV